MEALLADETVQRPELARRIGLQRNDVSDLLAGLEIRGLVQVAGPIGGLPGRSQQQYRLRRKAAVALGFDVGDTKVAGAICDMGGTVLAERTEATRSSDADTLIDQITGMAEELCRDAEVPLLHIRQTAIGLPASIDPVTGALSLSGNLPALEGAQLRDRLIDALKGDVTLDSSANLALIAGLALGAARGAGLVGALEVARRHLLDTLFGALPGR